MKLPLIALLLVVAGCAGPDPEQRVRRLEFRIDGGPVRSAESLREARGEIGDRVLEVWFDVPALPGATDPAILVDYTSGLHAGEVGGEPLDLSRRPLGLIPLRPEQTGRRARLEFRDTIYRSQGQIYAGSQRELVTAWVTLDIVQFIAGAVQFVVGALLGLAGLFRRGRSPYAWLALFLVTTGSVFVSQSGGFRNLLFLDPKPVAWLRDVSCFLYTFALTRFVIQVFGDSRRGVFRRLSWLALGAGATAVILHLLSVASISRTFVMSQVLSLVALGAVIAHAFRLSRAGDLAARRFLFGTLALALFATPDLLWGMGLPYHFEFNTAPIGILLFAFQMGAIIEWRLAERGQALARSNQALGAKLAEVEQKTREVLALNSELRHQIEQRSRDLGRVLAASGGATPPPALEPVEGQELGRYRVQKRLGAGGMGAVYEVERSTDGAAFALKVMTSAASPERAARFAREAEVAAKVSHENVVAIADVGILEGGVPFLVMELVRGSDLESEQQRFGDSPWALGILAQVAAGLEALHACGVVHRDLKPANVLLSEGPGGPRAKLADFGIAREHDGALDATLANVTTAEDRGEPDRPDRSGTRSREGSGGSGGLTRTGALIGTPLYMAPELGRGAQATPASDVFSFGILAYELLTGGYPFPGPPALTVLAGAALPEPAPLGEELPQDVRALVEQALCASPERRPSARLLALALARHTARSVA
jgi:hypothetical protein